jgi:hypothetical protein
VSLLPENFHPEISEHVNDLDTPAVFRQPPDQEDQQGKQVNG